MSAVERAAGAVERLKKIVAMFGSSHEGERMAALNLANEQLAKLRLSWPEIIVIGATASPPPSNGHRRPEPPPPDIDPGECPDSRMSDGMLRGYGRLFLAEHAAGAYDLGDVAFLASVLHQRRWSVRQREGFIRVLRRGWMIRREADL